MFFLRSGLIARATSRPRSQNKTRTPTDNEQNVGCNSPVENVHGLDISLFSLYSLIIMFNLVI